MNNKVILKIIPYIFVVGFFLFNIIYYQNRSNNKCKAILETSYYCVVKQKVEVIKDHDRTELKCKDIYTDSVFDLETIVIKPHNLLFDIVNEGDTLVKSCNSDMFVITNNNKRDSFLFSCED